MKKYLLRPVSLVLCAVLMLVGFITIADKTVAQEGDSGLAAQVDRMAEQIGKLAEALTPQSASTASEIAPMEVALQNIASGHTSPYALGCTADYSSWNSSAIPKLDSAWNLLLLPLVGPVDKTYQFIDINGDGLNDFFASQRGSFGTVNDCLLLNNGNGWDLAYRCVVARTNDSNGDSMFTYYGDCAG